MAYRQSMYGDPENMCDTLRRLERHTDNCHNCKYDGGMVLTVQLCNKGEGADSDGYCKHWEAK